MPKAYLFDLDGTLVYTDPLHFALWKTILSNYGIELTESLYSDRIRGQSDLSIWQAFGVGTDEDRALWTQWKEDEFERRVMETVPVDGGKEFIQQLAKESIAVVTNSNKTTATLLLSRLGIEANVLITADCCSEPKPSPRPYLMAMETLGVAPEDTVIFEDSPVGIQSALAAKPSHLYVIQHGYRNFIQQ